MWGARCTLAHWKSSWCWERRRGWGWCKGLLPQGGGWTLSTVSTVSTVSTGHCPLDRFFGHQVGFGEGGNVQEFTTLWLGGAEDCDHCHQVKIIVYANQIYQVHEMHHLVRHWLFLSSVHSEIFRKVASVILSVYSKHGNAFRLFLIKNMSKTCQVYQRLLEPGQWSC